MPWSVTRAEQDGLVDVINPRTPRLSSKAAPCAWLRLHASSYASIYSIYIIGNGSFVFLMTRTLYRTRIYFHSKIYIFLLVFCTC